MTELTISGEVRRPGPIDVLVLAAWCGLAAGELDVAVRIANRTFSPTFRLYLSTRHFVWLIPLINLSLFLAVGALLALPARRWPRRGAWWGLRLIIACALRRP
jgi:hypothetical protein